MHHSYLLHKPVMHVPYVELRFLLKNPDIFYCGRLSLRTITPYSLNKHGQKKQPHSLPPLTMPAMPYHFLFTKQAWNRIHSLTPSHPSPCLQCTGSSVRTAMPSQRPCSAPTVPAWTPTAVCMHHIRMCVSTAECIPAFDVHTLCWPHSIAVTASML